MPDHGSSDSERYLNPDPIWAEVFAPAPENDGSDRPAERSDNQEAPDDPPRPTPQPARTYALVPPGRAADELDEPDDADDPDDPEVSQPPEAGRVVEGEVVGKAADVTVIELGPIEDPGARRAALSAIVGGLTTSIRAAAAEAAADKTMDGAYSVDSTQVPDDPPPTRARVLAADDRPYRANEPIEPRRPNREADDSMYAEDADPRQSDAEVSDDFMYPERGEPSLVADADKWAEVMEEENNPEDTTWPDDLTTIADHVVADVSEERSTLLNHDYYDRSQVQKAQQQIDAGEVTMPEDDSGLWQPADTENATDARHFLVNSRDGLFAKVTNVIDDPETGMHDDGRFGIYEIAMSPDALQVVQSDAAQAVAIGHGFTGLSLAEPLVVSRDNAAGTETIVYPEFEGTTILPPEYDDLYAAMLRDPYVQNLVSAADALKAVFREAGIDAGDLDFTQLMVCPSPDGSNHLVLLDLEHYRWIEQ